MTIKIGSRSGNLIVPYTQTTRRTKQLDITISAGSNLSSLSVKRAVAIFYSDSNNIWRMKFNITCNVVLASANGWSLTVSNVLFKNTIASAGQSIAASLPGNQFPYAGAYAANNSNSLFVNSDSAYSGTKDFTLSGDVELDSEPTTYTTASNMEGLVNANVYIQPASDLSAGVLNYYKEGTFTPYIGDPSGVEPSGIVYSQQKGKYTRIGNVVTYAIRLVASTKGDLNASTYIYGLPYSCSNSRYSPSISIDDKISSLNYVISAQQLESSTKIALVQAPINANAAASTNVNYNTSFANGWYMAITGQYLI